MSDTLAGSITERITRESITLFYIELILFEEAAIQIANHRIVNFLTQLDNYVPSSVLKQINAIVSDHVRTIEFWDIQMNYPSSKKSVDDIREAFHIRKELELIERNKAQLLTITRRAVTSSTARKPLSFLPPVLYWQVYRQSKPSTIVETVPSSTLSPFWLLSCCGSNGSSSGKK